jgi:endothelin-converting enzyme/putative endopeptidase
LRSSAAVGPADPASDDASRLIPRRETLWRRGRMSALIPTGDAMNKAWLVFAILGTTALGAAARSQESHTGGFDLSQLDRSADPCVDFYQFACGGWRASHPLPADKARFGRYDEMSQNNQKRLASILEDAGKPGVVHGALEKQVGDYYAACMDEPSIESKGTTPIAPYLKKVDAAKDQAGLVGLVAELDESGIPALFSFRSTPDPHNASQVIAEVDQGGLSLPDRDYYLKTDPKSIERRQKFVDYAAELFTLLGDPADKARANAEAVLQLETQLATASMDRTARRDPKNLDHRMSTAEFKKLAPNFVLDRFVKTAGAPKFDSLNVAAPDFFKQVNASLDAVPLERWQNYLRWRIVSRTAPMLPAAFVDADYRFNGAYLRGTKAIEPRWQRCVRSVDGHLGEASGKLFVEKYFSAQGKQKIREIVDNVMAQLRQSIETADWMSPETRQKALVKLGKIGTTKLGFPDKYRDYSAVVVKRDDFVGSAMRASAFESHRQVAKIGKPVDKTEWGMTPPTVNAYYDPQFAEIVFPAGILQPPMFDLTADDAYSYGAIGRVAGHELTHGFDDEGRKFDADGNLTDWWTPADAKAFEERAACVDRQYSEYSPIDDGNGKPLNLNGKLTLGENVADNGGLRMAYSAYLKSLDGKQRQTVDGFTPEQRVFLGYAISRCENVTPEMSRLLVVTDPHSPGKFRLIGPISNMPEFQSAFACKSGQPMAPEKRCRVW